MFSLLEDVVGIEEAWLEEAWLVWAWLYGVDEAGFDVVTDPGVESLDSARRFLDMR